MEILEMFCDLLLARFGLITQLKELDEGISEAVSSIIWIAPRLADVAELKIVSDILQAKYGKIFADSARNGVSPSTVSEKLQHKMSIQAPPKLLVEKYLIEIAKIYNIEYEPDQSIMQSSEESRPEGFLIDLNERNNLSGGFPNLPPAPGFSAYPLPPPLPNTSQSGFNYPRPPIFPIYPIQPTDTHSPPSAPFNYNIAPNNPSTSQQETKDLNVDFIGVSCDL
jgi:vacuolar protein sorting-associated protein IST1